MPKPTDIMRVTNLTQCQERMLMQVALLATEKRKAGYDGKYDAEFDRLLDDIWDILEPAPEWAKDVVVNVSDPRTYAGVNTPGSLWTE